MTGEQLMRWRKARKWTQPELAKKLKKSVRTVRELEGSRRKGRGHSVPKDIELACYALDNGVTQFDGVSAR